MFSKWIEKHQRVLGSASTCMSNRLRCISIQEKCTWKGIQAMKNHMDKITENSWEEHFEPWNKFHFRPCCASLELKFHGKNQARGAKEQQMNPDSKNTNASKHHLCLLFLVNMCIQTWKSQLNISSRLITILLTTFGHFLMNQIQTLVFGIVAVYLLVKVLEFAGHGKKAHCSDCLNS